jgi:hypothetical protein
MIVIFNSFVAPARALSCEQRRIEQHPERAERLTAPLGPEPEEHHVARIKWDVEGRGLALQVFFADEVSR